MCKVRSIYSVAVLAIYVLALVIPTNNSSISPDDESSTYLDQFLELLEEHSGLSALEQKDRHPIETSCSDYKVCIVNANGTILWDVRLELYDSNMSEIIDRQIVDETTLNGCLSSTTSDKYNTCMAKVRQNMIQFLTNTFDNRFRTILEIQCERLAPTNCITLEDTLSM